MSPKPISGFTLLELLVVLAIAALAATLVVPNVPGLIGSNRLAAATDTTLAVLREARARAIAAGEAVAVEFDSTTATYRFADRAQHISDDISVELATVSGARVSIRFYPDGASSGAVIRLIGTSGERLISVDPLTSRIGLARD